MFKPKYKTSPNGFLIMINSLLTVIIYIYIYIYHGWVIFCEVQLILWKEPTMSTGFQQAVSAACDVKVQPPLCRVPLWTLAGIETWWFAHQVIQWMSEGNVGTKQNYSKFHFNKCRYWNVFEIEWNWICCQVSQKWKRRMEVHQETDDGSGGAGAKNITSMFQNAWNWTP